jgi:hypothetical protein
MQATIRALGRHPRPRTTLYADAAAGQTARSFGAAPLTASIEAPAGKRSRIGGLGGAALDHWPQ